MFILCLFLDQDLHLLWVYKRYFFLITIRFLVGGGEETSTLSIIDQIISYDQERCWSNESLTLITIMKNTLNNSCVCFTLVVARLGRFRNSNSGLGHILQQNV